MSEVELLKLDLQAIPVPGKHIYSIQRPLLAASAVFDYSRSTTGMAEELRVTAQARAKVPLKGVFDYSSNTAVSMASNGVVAFRSYTENESSKGKTRLWQFCDSQLTLATHSSGSSHHGENIKSFYIEEDQTYLPVLNPLLIQPALNTSFREGISAYYSNFVAGDSIYVLKVFRGMTEFHTLDAVEMALLIKKVPMPIRVQDVESLDWTGSRRIGLIWSPVGSIIKRISVDVPLMGKIHLNHN